MTDLYSIACNFFIYAFLGWCVEVVYAAVNHGKFVNRGFLNGPVCPIYGFGVVAVLYLLTPLKDNLLLLYAGSVLLTSFLELFTGFAMDKLFHHKWWDYSNNPLNIGGYVCLKFSLLWGLACVLVVDAVEPPIAALVLHLPRSVGRIALAACMAAILADAAVTVAGVLKLNKRLKQLDEIASALHNLSDAIGSNVAEGAIAADAAADRAKAELAAKRAELTARHEALTERLRSEQKRLIAAFPDLKSRRYPELLARVKDSLHK